MSKLALNTEAIVKRSTKVRGSLDSRPASSDTYWGRREVQTARFAASNEEDASVTFLSAGSLSPRSARLPEEKTKSSSSSSRRKSRSHIGAVRWLDKAQPKANGSPKREMESPSPLSKTPNGQSDPSQTEEVPSEGRSQEGGKVRHKKSKSPRRSKSPASKADSSEKTPVLTLKRSSSGRAAGIWSFL